MPEAVFNWRSDSSNLRADINATLDALLRMERELEKAGDSDGLAKLRDTRQSLFPSLDRDLQLLDKVIARQQKLQQFRAELSAGAKSRTTLGQISGISGLGEGEGLNRTTITTDKQARQELLKVDKARQVIIDAIAAKERVLSASFVEAGQTRLGLEAKILNLVEQRALLERRVERLTSGEARTDAIAQRLEQAQAVEAKAAARVAELREVALGGIKGSLANRIESEIERQTKIRVDAENEVTALRQRQADLSRRIGLGDTSQKTRDDLRQVSTELEGALQRLATANRRIQLPEGQRQALLEYSGLIDEIARAQAQQRRAQQESTNILSGQTDTSGLDKIRARLLEVNRLLEKATLETQERANLEREQAELVNRGAQALNRVADPGLIVDERQVRSQLPRLTQLFVDGFSDLSRRFVTTLQFAISGALIFGVQQAVREFITSAFEVERTFADIESAFEFDISAPRGSAEFSGAIRDIRLDTLALSEEFNLLPQEVNKAAFVMVARFSDSEQALEALRAQLLATKVSTIDQAEVLRALTAVADSFGSANAIITDDMDLQARSAARDAAAVKLYSKALDDATIIQQRFGIEVEDTLEGTARAAATFGEMGFTLQQTEAIIGAVSRTLGQTASTSSEKLVRSLGQLSSPQIRDELLQLATTSEALNLTFSDFESGATAWKKIIDQWDRLRDIDPAAAQQLAQIIGQRRETEVVSAALNSADLQREILQVVDGSTGAAQQRFDVLARTADEILKSIAAGFDQLAQNVAALEIITPFKLLLQIIDGLLTGFNKIATTLEGVKQTINEIGSIAGLDQLGTGLFRGASLIASIAGLGAITRSAIQGFQILRGNPLVGVGEEFARSFIPNVKTSGRYMQAFNKAMLPTTGAFAGLRAGLAASIAALYSHAKALAISARASVAQRFTGAGFAARFPTATNIGLRAINGGPLGRAAAGLTTVAGALGTSVGVLIGAFGGLAAAITYVVTKTIDMRKREQELANARAEAARLAEQRIRAEGIDRDSAQAEVIRNRAQLEALVQAEQDAPRDLFFNAARLGVPGAESPGSKLDLKRQIEPLQQQLTKDYINSFQEAVAEGSGDFESDDVARRQIAILRQKLSQADSVEEYEAIQTEVQRYFDDYAAKINKVVEGIEITAKQIDDFIKLGDLQLEFGETTNPEFLSGLDELIANGQQLLQDTERNPANIEALNDLEESIYNARRRRYEALTQSIDLGITSAEQDVDSISGAARRASLLQQKVAIAADEFGRSSVEYTQVLLDAVQAIQDARRAAADAILDAASLQVSAADTTEARISALRDYLDVLKLELGRIAAEEGFGDRYNDIWNQIRQVQDEIDDAIEDRARRLAEVRTRLGGPILSPITKAQAAVAGAREKVSQLDEDSTEYLEAQLELQEALASLAQAQFAQVSAIAIAGAGVRDSMAKLQVQYALAVKELELIVKLFGDTSAEFFNGQLKIEQAEAALIDAELQLQDINRRLGSDLSNSFEQAQLTIVEIARKLQVDGLGDLEKAQLELELAQAELDAVGAFFNQQLFDLRFLFETDAIDEDAYIGALRDLLSQVDTTTQQGKEIFLQITSLIEGLTDAAGELRFNIPSEIRLPTLFEVRRAVQAEQLGVNYQDNRQQDIRLFVSDEVEAEAIVQLVIDTIGGDVTTSATRLAPGGSRLTVGGVI